MIYPIRAYGDPILRKKARPVKENSPATQQLIDDMIQTMQRADGAGLAAPQIGKAVRIFVADLAPAIEKLPETKRPDFLPQPMVCINPEIIHKSSQTDEFDEGCLSIPNLVERIKRPAEVTLRYLNREFTPREITGFGPVASVLQHEYDHLEGILHIDYLSRFRKRVISRRLDKITKGHFEADYPMQIGEVT